MGRLKLRTFIALPLDDALRRRVVARQQDLAEAGSEIKWVEPENLHVTLRFLGEVDALEVVEVCRAVRGVAAAPQPLTLAPAYGPRCRRRSEPPPASDALDRRRGGPRGARRAARSDRGCTAEARRLPA